MSEDANTELGALLNRDGMNVIHSVALLAIMSGDKMVIAEVQGIVTGALSMQIETLTGTMEIIDGLPATENAALAPHRTRIAAVVALAERLAANELARARAWKTEPTDGES